MTIKDKELEKGAAYRRMIRMLGWVPWLTAGTAAFLIVEMAFCLARPWVLGRAVDAMESAQGGAGDLARTAAVYAAAFLALTLLMNLARFFHGDVRGRMVHGIMARLRGMALEKLHALSPVFYGAFNSGEVLSRVSRDTQKMRPFFGFVVFSLGRLGLIVAGSLVIMWVQSPLLALVTFACFGVSLSLMLGTARRLKPLTRKADDLYDNVSLEIKENIEGVKVVKAFGREPWQKKRFKGRLARYVDGAIEVSDAWTLRMPLAHAFFGLCVPSLLLVGGWNLAEGAMAKGAVVACLFYAARIFSELGGLVRLATTAQEASVSGQRFFELLDSRHTVPQSADPRPMPSGRGEVRFEGVSFAYPGAKPVLKDLTLTVRAGERAALVGPTGCGKSTMASLLLRFFDPQEGRILLDGADIRSLPLDELRRAVGCVFQETFLFSASLRRNLAYARAGASDEDILEAARTAQIGGLVETLPKGLDTRVGERGVTLSGGQKQRVAVARALLSEPRVLVLDDATASVDAQTEREMVGALGSASMGRTTLIITQRLSGVLLADRVIVLDRGGVLDTGEHNELYERCGTYRALFEGQVLETESGP